MTQGRAMEHEEMISEIKKFIEEKKDFFIGGRGIGIECRKMAVCWKVEIDRARFICYPDMIRCDHDTLHLSNKSGDDWFGKFNLTHYLKVYAI